MTKRTEEDGVSRRSFFSAVGKGVAGGMGAVAVAASGSSQAAEAPSTGDYRETDHVKKVYELSRF